MNSFRTTIALFLIMVLVVLTTSVVLAAEPEVEILPCQGTVSGYVVAIDPATNTVIIQPSEGPLCKVTITPGSYDHPIDSLLGMYFGDVDPATLAAALDDADTKTCAVLVGGVWQWQADCTDDQKVRVISVDEFGNAVAVTPSGEIITFIITDPDVAAHIGDELKNLPIDNWILDENGDLVQVSSQIAAYHADGMGFGVLVKLYALADSTGIPVEDLVFEFRSGKGMGQLFKEYGKPSKMGVGHVRHDKDKKEKGPPQTVSDDPDQPDQKNNGKKPEKKDKVVCKPKSNNGKGKANGHPACPTP